MKFFGLKFKKKNTLSLKSLRPPLFNTKLYWFMSLVLAFLIIIFTTMIGLSLFHREYFESYKEVGGENDSADILNIKRLNRAILKRNEIINTQVVIPKDPSI